MAQEAWLGVIFAVSVVAAIVLIAPVVIRRRAPVGRPASPGSGQRTGRPRDLGREQLRWPDLLPTFGPTPGARTVEGNFERALARIDAIDPYLGQQRIGEALAEVGLVSSLSVFDDLTPPEQEPSFGESADRSHRWEDEA